MKTFTENFEKHFADLHARSRRLIEKTPEEKLFFEPSEIRSDFPAFSVGGLIIRSAGRVEQTFNGICVKLWDAPFEWTLPESLSTNDAILDYLGEVEEIRRNGFLLFKTDEVLSREIPAPEKLKTLFEVLLETVAEAENFYGRAVLIRRFIK